MPAFDFALLVSGPYRYSCSRSWRSFLRLNYLVDGFDFGFDCGTPADLGTSVLLLSSDRSRESSLDHTNVVGIHPVGTDRPLVADLRVIRNVVPVLLAARYK